MKEITYSELNSKENLFHGLLAYFRKLASRHLHTFRRTMKMNAWSIKGVHGVENGLNVLFLGNQTDQRFFSNLIFKNDVQANFIGNIWLWELGQHIFRHRQQYDMIICQTRKNICNLLSSKKRFVIPDWVCCEIDLCNGSKTQYYHKKTMKQNIRRFMKNGYSYTISKDPNDFQFFYNQMYLPYISTRHMNALVKISYDTLKKNFDNGELLLIKEGQKIVAGGIINYSMMKGKPRGTQLGVYKGDYSYVKKGALAAYYYYSMEYLKEKKYECFSFGGTRPFFNDGVMQHKLSWGAKIVNESSNAFLLCLRSRKKTLKTFLVDNPFLCLDHNHLSLAVFDNQSSDKVNRLLNKEKKLKSIGIDRLKVIRI